MPTDRFRFEGFLPRKKGRQTLLRQLAEEPGTIVVYEAAVRLGKTIGDIVKHIGIIAKLEKLKIELTGLEKIIEFSGNDIRQIINLL